MTCRLAHNPRVIVGPGDPALAAEMVRAIGHGPTVGDWFLKVEGLSLGEAEAAGAAAVYHGGGLLTHPGATAEDVCDFRFPISDCRFQTPPCTIPASSAIGNRQSAIGNTVDAILRIPADGVGLFLGAIAPEHPAVAESIRATLEAWQQTTFTLRCGGRTLEAGRRTLLMGVVNVTPDSFSDGGQFVEPAAAIEQGRRLAAEGADILDIGGESTRPGAEPVDAETECRRVLPVIEALAREVEVPISVDTSKAAVARRALAAGASVLNDVTALRGDPEMASVAAQSGAPLVLMHMKGTPRTMQDDPQYDDLMSEVVAFLRRSMALAVEAGVREEQLIVDPGIGFGKTLGHNLEILRRLGELRSLGRPILVGTSRKRFIGTVLGAPVGERLLGTAASVAFSIERGAHIVRVHDVAAMRGVARMTDALVGRQG